MQADNGQTYADGLALILSNLAMLPAIIVSFYYSLLPEAFVLIVLLFVSSIYHLCQSGFLCIYSFTSLQVADHFYVYSILIWITLYFVGLNLQCKFIIFFVIQAALLPAVMIYLHSWILTGVVIAVLVVVALVVLGFFIKDFPVIDWLDIIIVFILLGGGFSLHYVSGDPGSPNYPAGHSMWHILSMLAIFFIIECKEGNSMVSRLVDGTRKYINDFMKEKRIIKFRKKHKKPYKFSNSMDSLIKRVISEV